MQSIKDLLGRFKDLLNSEDIKKDAIITAIKECVGINLLRSEINLNKDTVYINTKPIFRNEIFLKQEKILDTYLKLSNDNKIKKLL